MRSTPRSLAALLIFASATLLRGHTPPVEMVEAAKAFLGALDAAQKKKATYPLTDAERENWFFVPTARNGVSIKQMSAPQRALALALLKTGLSQRGMARAEAIMSLELVLREIERNTPPGRRDPELYFVTIFGEPGPDKTWGWRFEGHHLSFNFTLVDGRHVFFAPSFIGANPAEVKAGPRKGERVLAEEEDKALALINALDATQRQTAIFAEKALPDILTANQKRVEPLRPAGIAAAQLTPAQREQLLDLVKTYVARWRTELFDETMAEITKAGVDQITFAWAGGLDRSKQTYYRIQGPTFLIEFDNWQGNGNHIHTTFREFKGDFGHDLLAEHYAKSHKTQ